MLEALVKLVVFLFVLAFKLVYYLYLWTFMAFRALWKSSLHPGIKWGISGAVVLLVVIGPIVSSNHPSTQLTSAGGEGLTPSVAAAASSAPSQTASPTPAPTAAPTPKPVAATVVAKITAPPPKSTAPPPPPPAFSYCGAPSNPWHYNFCSGSVIYSPPSNFCGYFDCIKSFWTEDHPNDGYVIQCGDGTFSLSGGEAGGVCNYHNGPRQALYAP